MIKQKFFFLVLAVIFFPAFGQDDFVVTITGDTLFGKISFQQIGKVEQVMVRGEKKKNMSSIQVRMASVKNKVYRPVQYSGMVQMMEVITDGYLSLLAFQPPGLMSYDGRLLTLRSGGAMEVPTIGFKKHVSNFLSDDAELAAQISDGDLDRKDIDKIIAEFNLYIEKNTVATDKQSELESKQIPKLETINEMIATVRNSNMESKIEVLEMLTELKDKISNGKSIPQYLSNALRESLQSNKGLSEKLVTVLKD